MSTEIQAAPEVTIINRIGSIPLVSSSISAVHNTLSANRLTATPYATATAVSAYALGTANKYTGPIQSRIAPLVVRADGLANAAVDAVEARYPYPFQAKPDDVYNDLNAQAENARGMANKTIDDRVYAPAGRVVAGIDQRFTPLVDYIESYINSRFSPPNSPPGSPSTQSERSSAVQYNYQRAYALTLSLRDSLYATSSAQIKQLQDESVLVQHASATAHVLSNAAQTNVAAVGARVNHLSEMMLADLQTVKQATASLPTNLQEGLSVLNRELGGTIYDLAAIVRDKELAAGDKIGKVRDTVQQRVQPLLDATTAKISEILETLRAKKVDGKKKVAETYEESPAIQERLAAFHEAAQRSGIKIESDAPETDVAAAAREHTQQAQDAGASYADAAKDVVYEKLNST